MPETTRNRRSTERGETNGRDEQGTHGRRLGARQGDARGRPVDVAPGRLRRLAAGPAARASPRRNTRARRATARHSSLQGAGDLGIETRCLVLTYVNERLCAG